MDGAVILDKPKGVTSHDAVQAARRLLQEHRIGHLGTLDPFATGVLVLLLGTATRLARFYSGRDKSYQGIIRFGFATDTYDASGSPASPQTAPHLEEVSLRALFADFVGPRQQQPPPFSAKKVSGVRSYRLARKGKAVPLQPVPIVIHELELLSVAGCRATFRARVSSGTYLRSLAHELGQRMGCGAHLEELHRTAVGEFSETQAVTLEQLEDSLRQGRLRVVPPEDLLPEFPSLLLSPSESGSVSHGNSVLLASVGDQVKLLHPSGKLLAIASRGRGQEYHPIVVFPSSSSAPSSPSSPH